MKLIVEGFEDGGAIPEKFAFGAPDPDDHVRLSDNLNPGIRWEDVPDGTKTLALICVDSDVPTDPEDVNQEGRTVPASLLRARFYHWVIVDLPPGLKGITEGECSRGVTARGKQSPYGPEGSRQGRNDYTLWFEGDPDMGGIYLGYDGPCPPWNDSIPHHYHFVLYATDLERCPVEGAFTALDVETVLAGHVLARAEVTGVYSLNPAVPASSR
jgi:Raf kinase inhibitor-like YbhB/YbcL family protein